MVVKMTAIPNNARITLAAMKSQPVKRSSMPQHMENMIAAQMSNQQKADLWKRNPMTNEVLKGVYNDR